MLQIFKRSRPPFESSADRVCRAMSAPKRLLLVEDEISVREIVALAVRPYAVELTATDSVSQAREALGASDPFDAALLDYRLINGDGIMLYRDIIWQWPKMQVIFMTGYANDKLRREVEAVGPARVYDKTALMRPVFFENLLAQFNVARRESVS